MFEVTTIDSIAAMAADEVLHALTQLRLHAKAVAAADAALLDRLDDLASAGEVDQGGFSYNDWSFSWSPGRRTWAYPEPVESLAQKLKAAQKAAQGDGSATASTGAPYWTIKPPRQ
jgi:hypothetical protein